VTKAAPLDIREEMVAQAARDGLIKVYRCGQRRRLLKSDVEQWIRNTWRVDNVNA
jgi:excisionase family DNA binding protein